MNISEANDINTVLRYVLRLPNGVGEFRTAQQVHEAAERLAGRAHKTLSAGLMASDVRDAPLPLRDRWDG